MTALTWDELTAQQRVALRQPAYFAVECVHSRYARTQQLGSLVLTVNAGYE